MGVLGLLQVGHRAADRVRDEGPGPRRVHARLDGRVVVPLQPAGVALLRHGQHPGRLRALHVCNRARGLLGPGPVPRGPVPNLLVAPLHVQRQELRHQLHHQRKVRDRHGRVRPAGAHQHEHILRARVRAQLRGHRGHHHARRAVPRQGDLPPLPRVAKGQQQARRAHAADEAELRGRAGVVVLRAAGALHGRLARPLHGPQERGAAAVVGPALRVRPGLRVHAAHQHHHGHHQPDPRAQRHLRVHHRAHPPGQAHRQRRLQGVRLHEHVAGHLFPLRLQAGTHYMKIPPKSMFLVQLVGTIVAGTVNLGVAYWLLGSIPNICNDALLPADSPWTCPSDRVFFDASVIWGLVGPRRIFGALGNYAALNWSFLVGARGARRPVRAAQGVPAQAVDRHDQPARAHRRHGKHAAGHGSQLLQLVAAHRDRLSTSSCSGTAKSGGSGTTYILSAALDAGVAFMGVLLYFTLSMENRNISWWGTAGEHCPLASCPTA
ncbi:hypothetical protein PR202_gb05451 [Eleusine coracana subsp. coracana]|uniref:Uncharacterized protein n=1 Tax=Eleusine coracana subsp. coracana TaxID=191504 RepID=A0AAV5E709_ELECO|nr:hypothetical protein PR202_gb05451 [Eleusine coracana subsp. coracana]